MINKTIFKKIGKTLGAGAFMVGVTIAAKVGQTFYAVAQLPTIATFGKACLELLKSSGLKLGLCATVALATDLIFDKMLQKCGAEKNRNTRLLGYLAKRATTVAIVVGFSVLTGSTPIAPLVMIISFFVSDFLNKSKTAISPQKLINDSYKGSCENFIDSFLEEEEYVQKLREQLLSQTQRLSLEQPDLSEEDRRMLLRKSIKKNFNKLNSDRFSSKFLENVDKETDIKLLMLIELQTDYGLKMKKLRHAKYTDSKEESFEKDWSQKGSNEEIGKTLEGWRLSQFKELSFSSETALKNYATDFMELATSANVQALTTTFYLASINKEKLLGKSISQAEHTTIKLPNASYEIVLDQRNIKTEKSGNAFFEKYYFVAKAKSECHYESIDYIMELGQEYEEGFRLFQKGYLLYQLASPAGKMVRFELPIDLTPFEFESIVGVNEAIKLMLGFYFNAEKMSQEEKFQSFNELLTTLQTDSQEHADVVKLIKNYKNIAIWAQKTANTLSGLYEKIYLSLNAETTLSGIQNVEDEMGYFYLSHWVQKDKSIHSAYQNYLVALDEIKSLILQKEIASRKAIDRLKNNLMTLIKKKKLEKEELFIIESYLDQQIQDALSYGQEDHYLKDAVEEVKEEFISFLDCKVFPLDEEILMNRKVCRDFHHFLRACRIAKEENSKKGNVDKGCYHNQRLVKMGEELHETLISCTSVLKDDSLWKFLLALQEKAFEIDVGN